MSKIFKPNELVRIISLPWDSYGDDVVHIGDIVTIHSIRPAVWDSHSRYAVMKEFLTNSPQHNIGTSHLKSTGLNLNQSRNKREGKLILSSDTRMQTGHTRYGQLLKPEPSYYF